MDIIELIRPYIAPPLLLAIIAVVVWHQVRKRITQEVEDRDSRLDKQIHAGLTAWVNNGGGMQIRRIVKEESVEAGKAIIARLDQLDRSQRDDRLQLNDLEDRMDTLEKRRRK